MSLGGIGTYVILRKLAKLSSILVRCFIQQTYSVTCQFDFFQQGSYRIEHKHKIRGLELHDLKVISNPNYSMNL